MEEKLITIGITSYNSQNTIKDAINSAISQLWCNKEIIIVDDFSTDNSQAIIKSINFQGVKHKLIFKKENKGCSHSRNQIIKNATGTYICFFDDDDVSHPDRINKQFNKLVSYQKKFKTNKIACYASSIRDYQNGYKKFDQAIGSQNLVPVGKNIIDYHFSKNLKKNIFFGSGTPTSSLFISKEVFNIVGYFDENLLRLEDTDLAIRLGERHFHFIGCKEPLIKQFIYPAQYKTGFANYESEMKLFRKYSNYIDEQYLKYISLWHLMKANYFSGKVANFILNISLLLIRYPKKSFQRIMSRGIRRLIHDFRINVSINFLIRKFKINEK